MNHPQFFPELNALKGVPLHVHSEISPETQIALNAKLTATKGATVAALAGGADLAAVITAFNALLTSLKAANIIA